MFPRIWAQGSLLFTGIETMPMQQRGRTGIERKSEGIWAQFLKGYIMHSNRQPNRYRAVRDRSNRKRKPNSHCQASQHTSIGPLPSTADGVRQSFPLFPILLFSNVPGLFCELAIHAIQEVRENQRIYISLCTGLLGGDTDTVRCASHWVTFVVETVLF